jgi:hypothetical protein
MSFLSTTGKLRLFEEIIIKIIQRQFEEGDLIEENYFGFRIRHSTALQCTGLKKYLTLNFNNYISTAAVYSYRKRVCCINWVSWNFFPVWSSLLVLLCRKKKLRFSVESEICTLRDCKQVCLKILSHTQQCTVCIQLMNQTLGVNLTLLTYNTCMCAMVRKEGCVPRKCQRDHNSVEIWCKRWSIKFKDDVIQAVSHTL